MGAYKGGNKGYHGRGGAGQGVSLIITPKTPFKRPDYALTVPLEIWEGEVGFGVGEGWEADFGGAVCLNEAVAEESERRYRRLVFVSER